jgi:hypothetical protein
MSRYINPVAQYLDGAGSPVVNGQLFYFESEQNLAKSTFADQAETIVNTNPVILDSAGRAPNIFYTGSARVVLQDSANVQVWERDPVGDQSSFADFGQWLSYITYDVNDIVELSNNFYISKTIGNQGNDPSVSSGSNVNWTQIDLLGLFNTSTTYSVGSIVFTSNGKLWASVVNSNLNHDPLTDADGDYWTSSVDVPAVKTTTGLIASNEVFASNIVINTSGYTTAGTGAGSWKQNGVTGQTVSQSPAQLGVSLLNDGNGDQWAMSLTNTEAFDTFAQLEASTSGNVGQELICRARADAAYLIQPSGYSALAGDATLASGLVAALQKSPAGWHIEHFGAVPDTDSTTAIKNAISRAASSVIVGNAVAYWFDEELLFSENNSGLAGIGGVMSLFNLSLTETSLRFSPATPELGNRITNNTIENVELGRSGGSSGAIALKLHQVAGLKVSNFQTLASHTAIEIKGIRASNFDQLHLNAGNLISPLAGSALITYDGYPLTAGGYTEAWTTNINNIIASCGFNTAYVFDLRKSDGLQISNGYLASPLTAHVNIEPLDSASGVGTVIFTSIYFDGINKDTGSINGLLIPTHVGYYVNDIKFIGSKFGGFQSNIINIIGVGTNIEFNGTTIRSSNGKGIRAASNAETSIKMIGGNVGYCDNAVNIDNIKAFIMNGTLINDGATGVTLLNTSTAALDNISFENVTTELDITNVPVLTGGNCVSDVNGIVDVNSGTFTPTLRINFSTTGLVYAEQLGNYVKNGNVVTFTASVTLSSKGTETGVITIQDLPFAIKNISSFSVYANALSSGDGESHLQAKAAASSSFSLSVRQINAAGNAIDLTNADITDTTNLIISGSYIAD